MRIAPCLLLLLLLLLAPARAQDGSAPPASADAEATKAIEDTDRLIAEGRLREARTRYDGAAKALAASVSPDVKDDLFVARVRLGFAAARGYAAGEDHGMYDHSAFKPGDFSTRKAARKCFESLVMGFQKLEAPHMRARLLADPALRALDDLPEMRFLRWSHWRTTRGEVWPDTTLDTGEAEFDALFARLAKAPIPDEGYEIEPLHDWLEAHEAEHRTPGAVWAFRFRCALGNPINQGGWPTRMGLLTSPETCRKALAELTPAGDATPQGFGAAVLVNLHIAAGQRTEALVLLRALRASGPRFLYDVTLHHAQQLAAKQWVANKEDPELTAFSDGLDELTYGLPEPEAKPAPGR